MLTVYGGMTRRQKMPHCDPENMTVGTQPFLFDDREEPEFAAQAGPAPGSAPDEPGADAGEGER